MTTRCSCRHSNPEPETVRNVAAAVVVAASVVGLGVIFFRKYNEGMKEEANARPSPFMPIPPAIPRGPSPAIPIVFEPSVRGDQPEPTQPVNPKVFAPRRI